MAAAALPVSVNGPAYGQSAMFARDPHHLQRVAGAIATIQSALKRSKRPYVAFSGGKDSLVVPGWSGSTGKRSRCSVAGKNGRMATSREF